MGQTYRLDVTPELAGFWSEALRGLSPQQVREGFLIYSMGERSSFPPTPGAIIECAPEAKDKPKLRFKADCPQCEGSGWAYNTAGRVSRCACRTIEYAGEVYTPAPQLTAGPTLAQTIITEARKLGLEIPDGDPVKPMPPEPVSAVLLGLDGGARERELQRQRERLGA